MSEQQTLGMQDAGPVGSVEGYEFEPIKGYPMLQWKGKRPFRSTQFFPAQLREVHGPEVAGWRSKVYWGDNLQVMSHLLKEFRGQIQLVYIDPPFDSRVEYRKRVTLRGQEVLNDRSSFEEKQYSDMWVNDEYIQFMYERLVLMRELLAESGSIYVHCDYRVNSHLRLILDEIFGSSNIVNEVIWWYEGPQSPSPLKFASKHDMILRYARNFEQNTAYELTFWQGEPFDPLKYSKDESERYFYTIPKGDYTDESIRRLDAEGKIHWTSKGTARIKKLVEVSADGKRLLKLKKIPDVWQITSLGLAAGSKENLAYPTQKPEALLERIIRASSKPGDIVFDCFMGSGTTQAVAMKLGRRFIGADINLGAVQITTRRLIQVAKELGQRIEADKRMGGGKQLGLGVDEVDGVEILRSAQNDMGDAQDDTGAAEPTVFYTGFEVYNVNYYDIFRNPVEAKELLMAALEVQPLAAGSVYDGTKDGRMVKVMPVNRIATRADLNDLIANFDYKAFERRYAEHPTAAVEKIMLVCMGHELDLAAALKKEVAPKVLDVEVFDVLRDGQHLQFKRDAEARVRVKDGWLVVEAFYPMNLLGKLSLQKESVEDWRELADSVMVDWNYDGAVLMPAVVDIPEKNGLVVGRYRVPEDAGTIRVKITDLLSESWEGEA